MKVIKFGSDTKHRKQWFTGISFSHPAKMSLPLQLWIIDNFTQEGETILDPMAGSGTILVACSMGRNVITLELEDKFVQMQKDNWEIVKQRGCQMGYSMGTAVILQGDARNLEGLLVDKCIFSPPFADARSARIDTETVKLKRGWEGKGGSRFFDARQGDSPDNISNLPYGEIDKIVTSPPYAERHSYPDAERERQAVMKLKAGPNSKIGGVRIHEHESDNPENLGNLPYGSIDAVISSPPYEGSISGESHTEEARSKEFEKLRSMGYKINPNSADNKVRAAVYSGSDNNIGNLKSDSYLSAMLLVYQNCFAVLKAQGLLILVTKNFIRNKAQVRLDLDTIKLCEQAGFSFKDRWYRELSSQSFWRTIYHQKYPNVEPIKFEDILVFQK